MQFKFPWSQNRCLSVPYLTYAAVSGPPNIKKNGIIDTQ